MRIELDVKLDFQDVLLKPKRSTIVSRSEINLIRTFKFRYAKCFWELVPIISANMLSVTTPKVVQKMNEHKMAACIPKQIKDLKFNSPGIRIQTVGLREEMDYEATFGPALCVDAPNGYIEKMVDRVKEIREVFASKIVLIAGNVVTPEMTEALILAGADIVKVGLGSGAACATRIKTGVGYPQLSAVIECADAAHGLGGHIISDGGCISVGDIAKAFAAGADFVMLGGMLAGHDENGVEFFGSASKRAASLESYRAAEGWEMKLPPRGPIDATLQEIEGGLRSACSYVGAKDLKSLPKCATLIRVNRQINTSLLEYRV
jgi:GMP reductase